jgi:GntR family transcriptional repressor for pyruvate dehydrogenase complex
MGVSFEPVERITVSEEITKKVIELINNGALQPGDKLPSERDLMEQLQVSRSSVREALRSLSLVGILDTRPGDGTYVSEHLLGALAGQLEWGSLLGKQDLLELMEVREPLEIYAAGVAAERADAAQLAKLRATVERCQGADAAGDMEALLNADYDFHVTLVRMTGNHALAQLLEIFNNLLREYVKQQRLGFCMEPPAEASHEAIYQAVEGGDKEAARAAMTRHIRVSKQMSLAQKLKQEQAQDH